jgi:hypothetical protein
VTPKVEREANALPDAATPFAAVLQALPPLAFDPDGEAGYRLPPDHPAWARDVVSLSQRARALVARLKPVAIRAIAAWEHRVRALVIGGRRVSVDPSGSYRVD